jgi:hypothetical protein
MPNQLTTNQLSLILISIIFNFLLFST